ncbi:MAG: glycine--tRNA ligase [Solobacterium sp.]|nr:glycine--tRNA ligase [Solobacterium sp.]
MDKTFDQIVSHAKDTGFVFQGSEIYGGLSNTWDYGPLGVALKDNIKRAWQKKFIQEDPNNVEIQAAILMNPRVWEASGHLKSFSDPLMDCRHCKTRHRADHLIEEFSHGEVTGEGWTKEEMETYIKENHVACPNCGSHDFTPIRQFNLMFKTFQGIVEDDKDAIYLRPETAQGMFVDFKGVQRAYRKKLPFGIGQIGKSFRNEITPGNFIFRTREFEQMEMEFFCKPGEDDEWYAYWKQFCMDWILSLGGNPEHLRFRDHAKEELSFYSKATSDIEYAFPWGWGELWGIANRTDYDLTQHMNTSGEDLRYLDPQTNEKYVPYCVEPAVGVERLFLMFFSEAYDEETLENGDVRTVMHFSPILAPVKAAVLPLRKSHGEFGRKIRAEFSKYFVCEYDESGSIGKRYRRQDEVGTPFCITVDEQSLQDQTGTVRYRDSMKQDRMTVEEVITMIQKEIAF